MPVSLVTGATGFIGRRLVDRLLREGEEVTCLVRPSSRIEGLEREGVRLAQGSLSDGASLRRAVDGVDTVYHLAGKTHAATLGDYLKVNEAGAERVCSAAADCDSPPTVLAVSSLAVVGPSPVGEPHTESTPCRPISNYGKSKLAGEVAVRRFAGKAPLSIVRPPVVFGPGDRDGLVMLKAIRRLGMHFVPQRQGLPLSVVYVDDLIEALIAVAQRGERVNSSDTTDPQGLYFAADPEVTSYAEVGRLAAEAMGRKAWVWRRRKYPLILPAMIGDLWARATGKAPLMGMDKLREASASGWVCDPRKIVQELGWNPSEPIGVQYRHTVEWYQAEGWL